ncbi:MAG: hypothetical protein EXS64_19910 [Candidatus Latescibacteria bacterium]|nr:hypothetical protein [Candidatus Latescibacterota bacterium]
MEFMWVFGILTFGCLAILVKILLDYSAAASEWHAMVRQAKVQQAQAESQVDVFVKGKEEALARTSTVEQERKQHEKKGKVILHRGPPGQ